MKEEWMIELAGAETYNPLLRNLKLILINFNGGGSQLINNPFHFIPQISFINLFHEFHWIC